MAEEDCACEESSGVKQLPVAEADPDDSKETENTVRAKHHN